MSCRCEFPHFLFIFPLCIVKGKREGEREKKLKEEQVEEYEDVGSGEGRG